MLLRSSLEWPWRVVFVVFPDQLSLASYLSRTHFSIAVESIAYAAWQSLLPLSLA